MTRRHLIVLAIATLAGCQAPYPNEQGRVYGDTVRAVLASEVIAPQPHPERGADGAAASAAYTNYQKSYVSPTPQSASPTIGSK